MWGAFLGAGVNGLASLATASLNNYYAKEAAQRNYNYSLSYLRESPQAQRQGLESAGYNPMLALGHVGAGTYQGSEQAARMETPDLVGGAKAAAKMAKDITKGYKLQNEKAEKEIENLESDLATKEVQRQQIGANASLAQSQSERSDLAYGLDIANTLSGVAGTASSLYSAKAMSDVAKQNAATNARNATVNERKANTTQVEVRRNAKGQKVGKIQRSTPANGVPSVSSSANSAVPNASGMLGGSSKSVGSVAKGIAKQLLFLGPLAAAGWGAVEGFTADEKSTYKRMEKAKEKSYWSNLRLR